MHKSRLCGFSIDCQTGDLETNTAFWSRALGHEALPVDHRYPHYVALDTALGEPDIEVQQVAHASRVHLDIETDDVEAETRRLENLGARRIAQIREWWVMEAPTGHRFCVVPAVTADFAEKATRWD